MRRLLFAIALPVAVSAQVRPLSRHPRISGDTAGAACSPRQAAADIQAWFIAMSIGDTAGLRRVAQPSLIVFSAGSHGDPEAAVRADDVDQLVRYVTDRHRVRDHWSLLEVQFTLVRGNRLGFMPIARRDSRDALATKGMWLGKAEYECGRGVRVLNLAPWPAQVPAYRRMGDRAPSPPSPSVDASFE